MIYSKIMPLLALAASTSSIANDTPAHPNLAYNIVEGLTTEVGQRLAGTEAEARARDWGVAKLKALGFANVHIEPYDMPVWVRGVETAEVVAPYPQKLALTALGNSGATADAGLTAEIVAFPSLAALKAAPDAAIKGKIVYVTHQMMGTQDGSSYGYFGPVRFIGPSIAAKKGAAAYLLRSLGTNEHRVPHTGVTDWEKGVAPIPAAALSVPDAENIDRMLARAGQPIVIHLTLTPKFTGTHASGNVIAEVPGSDPSAGIVVIGGHLDSWDLGTGAIDDGAGVAITTAAAHRLLAGSPPKRTIRVVWWGSEEEGGFGSDAYFKAHKGEKHAIAAESDFGADRVWAWSFKAPASSAAFGDRLGAALAPLGIVEDKRPAHGGADVEKLIEAGTAVVDLRQDGTHYFDIHHTADDTLDKIDPAQIEQNVAAWTVFLQLAANAPETFRP
jgi:hypothetical protein